MCLFSVVQPITSNTISRFRLWLSEHDPSLFRKRQLKTTNSSILTYLKNPGHQVDLNEVFLSILSWYISTSYFLCLMVNKLMWESYLVGINLSTY